MAARKTAIEFLPQEDWEKGTLGKILKWTLTVGRHIVIFTELVVILAFLSRFKLDRDLTDLGEKIKQQQVIIQASSEFEKEFRFLNKRIQTIESLRKDQLEAEGVLKEITSLIPLDVQLTELNITGNQLSFTSFAPSERGLDTFLKKLKESSKFQNISLSQINVEENGIRFQVKGILAKK